MNQDQLKKAQSGAGFIAALDQSGGSTPKALKLYGISEDAYSGDEQMFDLVHEMRTRIITSPAFNGDRIMGAILFEMTMDRQVEGRPTADYLWNVKNIVPFLKIDKGLNDEQDGAQTMKPMPGLDDLLDRAVANGVFGTKERSVIKLPGAGLDAVVAQQFEVGPAGPREGSGADHRARGRHQEPEEGRGRGSAQRRLARRRQQRSATTRRSCSS